MTPVQTIALLVLGVLLWKRLVRIGCLLVSVPLLLLDKALMEALMLYYVFVGSVRDINVLRGHWKQITVS